MPPVRSLGARMRHTAAGGPPLEPDSAGWIGIQVSILLGRKPPGDSDVASCFPGQ